MIDLVLRNAAVPWAAETPVDVGIDEGRIVAIEPRLIAEGQELDVGGRLVAPAFVETHIHLDKSCLLDRCRSDEGTLAEAIAEVAAAKSGFTEADVHERARRALEKCIVQGTAHMRTHVEVDPVVGLRGIDGVRQLVDEYRWAIDIELCVFPQEGLLNNPGTDELMVEALARGAASVVGAAPYTDSDPRGQIDRVFELAREFDVDVDMHLDFGSSADGMQTEYVCRKTSELGWEGRVTVGHVTQLTTVTPERFDAIAGTLAESGVAVTVLPSTDLFLMGRDRDEAPRGVVPAQRLLKHGVNCSLSTNNVLNPFTPFGDCSLVRMANLFANVAHVGQASEMADCFDMVTRRSARILRLAGYGVEVGCNADLVVLDCTTPEGAVAELAQPLYGLKRGRRTFTRPAAEVHRP